MKYFFILLLFYFSFSTHSNAQESIKITMVSIETEDDYFTGELISLTLDSILIYNIDIGLIQLSKAEIKSFRRGIVPYGFTETTNSSVPYYVQSAMPNGRGNHYYKNYYIFGNEFNYGLNDNWNLSVGFETASLIFDGGHRLPIIQFGAKYGVPVAYNVYTGFSAKYYFNEEGSVLMFGAPITIGNNRTNFTISPHYIDTEDESRFMLLSNMSLALNSKWRFIADFVYVGEDSVASVVFEYLFDSGFSISMGGIGTSDGPGPNASFSIPFGAWKGR